MPEISIVMPFYNPGRIVAETIDSILGQSFADFELIIVNDGSDSENSSFLQTLDDSRIVIINQANSGVANARNTGVTAAKGNYIAFADQDDLWAKEKLAIQYDMLANDPDCVLNYTAIEIIGNAGRRTIPVFKPLSGYVSTQLARQNPILTASCVMVRKAVLSAGHISFRTQFEPCDDWDFYLQLSLAGKFSFAKQKLTFYRLHQNNLSNNLAKMYLAGWEMLSFYRTHPTIFKCKNTFIRLYIDWQLRKAMAEHAYGMAYITGGRKKFRQWIFSALTLNPLDLRVWKLFLCRSF